jgi:hypothetical protein
MLFLASGRYTSPVEAGGKGICEQKVATQLGSTEGTQLVFQAHVTTWVSYWVLPGPWKLP